jgi:hypothetical protein
VREELWVLVVRREIVEIKEHRDQKVYKATKVYKWIYNF